MQPSLRSACLVVAVVAGSAAPVDAKTRHQPSVTKKHTKQEARAVSTQTVPNRYASVVMTEAARGNYAVTVNGMPVLVANRQPEPLHISRTYALNGEDAVIFTSHDGNNGCNFRNYLVSVRSDGTVTAPREVGNCSGGYQALVQNGALLMNFPTKRYVTTASAMWDRWRYTDQQLAHM